MLNQLKQRLGGDSGSEAAGYGKRAGLLSIGVGLAGLVTYLFFAISSHVLSTTQYGELVICWSAVFITVSILQRPVEQLLSRTISEHIAHGEAYSRPIAIAAGIQILVSAAFLGIALLLRGPIQDGLLHGNSTLYWIGIAAIAAYGASYFARGFLAGSHRLTLYASLIISESMIRTLFPVLVAVGAASGQTAVALGIVAAPALSLICVPLAFISRGDRGGPEQASQTKKPAGEKGLSFSAAKGGWFAAAVLVIMLSEQTFLNAGPLLVSGTAGAAAAGYIFNILMIARAPLLLFQAVTTSLLPHLTRLRAERKEKDFHSSVRGTVLAVLAFGLVVAGVMALIGPFLMQLAFSDKFTYERVGLVLVSLGMGLYLCAATLNQGALAQGQVRRAATRWIVCAVIFVAWTLSPLVGAVDLRVEIGFMGSAALLCGLLYLIYRDPKPEAGHEITPDSPEEVEVQLAAADEGS